MMRFFDLNNGQSSFIKETVNKELWRPRRIWSARPRAATVRCIAFLATATLVGEMLAGGLPVRAHPLHPTQYVVPEASVSNVTFRDLISRKDFVFLSTVILVTSGTSQTSPADWNNANNSIEGIGAGGGGGRSKGSATDRVAGGGAGEYRRRNNYNVATPGTTAFNYVIGAPGTGGTQSANGRTAGGNGTDTTFDSTALIAKAGGGGNVAASGGTCNGGAAGTGGTGPDGNANGGRGGNVTHNGTASGAGGAAGPNGAGAQGADSTATNGTTDGGTGDNGSGGAGGVSGTPNGGDGLEWEGTHGLGGGGRGGRGSVGGNIAGGTAGLYGAGGGSALNAGAGNAISRDGSGGLLVITYTPAAGGANTAAFFLMF